MLEQIRLFIQEQSTCVLATAADNHPHTSLMAFAPAQDSRTLYMATLRDTKKFANVSRNPSVSVLIDDRSDNPTPKRSQTQALTISGTATSVADGVREDARALLLARHPHLEEFLNHPDVDFIAVNVETVLLLSGVRQAHFERVSHASPVETAIT